MSETPKNVILLLDGDKMRAEVKRGVQTPRNPVQDYPISGYQISYAMNGGYVITVAYEGTELKDYLTFNTKEDLLGALQQILR